ncbi:50S ribosomal protein-like protein L4 [Paraphoma chrysanthemicola]|uniref:Large ribosomal subunit protein uL4m n=1 Tax=Paraphoma chrysanthemicola TaxID=798071 RepID=A0A8K0W2Y9_9PLEO|nr:50S ribosomal protein-like protein L4 [Paraphoma chrysanthemicola]
MASTRISAPVRGVTYQLSRLSIRQDALSSRCNKCLNTPFARSITTSASTRASLAPITTSATSHVDIKPLEEQTVLATIHQFPSLEPLRFETYPANHLYLPTRRDILHRAVVFEGDSTREGTASTKSRHEVRGSARKVRPQKGSGRARLGDKKSPMLRGGGVAFGPRPRDFATDLPKKVYDLAWRTALSYRYRKGELIIVDNAMEIESPSARLLGDIFKYHEKLRGRGRSLLVTLNERPFLEEALLDMDRGGQALTWKEVDVKDLLELSRVIIERDALHNILHSHQEDLTHTSIEPWHKSLIKSSRPAELESLIGWSEFRDLALKEEKDQEAARPGLYESVALKRYEYVASLPDSPHRTAETISAYSLLASARELQFKQTTGLSFSDYSLLISTDPASLDFESVAERFPRVQELGYQRSKKDNLIGDLGEVAGSEKQVEALQSELDALELEKFKIVKQAALFAAQVHEHYAEAHRMAGNEDAADRQIGLASMERENMDVYKQRILEAKHARAVAKVEELERRGKTGDQLEKARKAVTGLERRMARGSEVEEEEYVDETQVPEEVIEPPVKEEVRRAEEKK